MKVTRTQQGKFNITGLTEAQLSLIQSVIYSSKQCFPERTDSGEWYSNDDFVCTLTDDEKIALDKIEL